MAYQEDFNTFVGGLTGAFKGIKVTRKGKIIIKNLQNTKHLSNKNQITALNWGDDAERDILMGLSDQSVKVYDTEHKQFISSFEAKHGKGPIIGLAKFNRHILAGYKSGDVKFLNCDNHKMMRTEWRVGPSLDSMKVKKHLMATGGEENQLKLWDLNSTKLIYHAKNVKPDFLDLKVPVFISDIGFFPSNDKIVYCSKHGHVRIHDPSVSQKRPVLDMSVKSNNGDPHVLTALAIAPMREQHVVVGSAAGQMSLLDLRHKGIPIKKYKSFRGSIKAIAVPETEPIILTVSLDRFFRIHNMFNHGLRYQQYFQSRLSSILIRSDFSMSSKGTKEDVEILD
nr:PREDICTED: WD repeat-containing protein 74 [Bemisia tabaci]